MKESYRAAFDCYFFFGWGTESLVFWPSNDIAAYAIFQFATTVLYRGCCPIMFALASRSQLYPKAYMKISAVFQQKMGETDIAAHFLSSSGHPYSHHRRWMTCVGDWRQNKGQNNLLSKQGHITYLYTHTYTVSNTVIVEESRQTKWEKWKAEEPKRKNEESRSSRRITKNIKTNENKEINK